jgi:hypothetical protein
MLIAALLLVLSVGLFLFYLQAACEGILRHKFAHSNAELIVRAMCLAFVSVRKLVDAAGVSERPRLRMALTCDLLALTYFLAQDKPSHLGLTRKERMLAAHFRVTLFFARLAHSFGFGEKAALLKLTDILEYFSNVAGERMNKNSVVGIIA